MANPEHLQWLREGAPDWNARVDSLRAKDPGWRADLRDADLRSSNLGGVNLTGANLMLADLRQGNLRTAGLRGADLRDAYLAGTDLREADLGDANLNGVKLWRTQLGGADLGGADLPGADVSTTLENYIAKFVDLSHVLHLTQDQLDTMDGDSGTILPENLTRPAHWPDWEPPADSKVPDQERLPDHPFILLSYSSIDRETIARKHDFLEEQGIPTWWDQDIPAGWPWREAIAERLQTATAVLTFWTEASTKSLPVIEEASTAQQARKLLHARLDNSQLPYGFGETQYVDLRDWDGTATHPGMAKLLLVIRDKLSPPTPSQLTSRLVRSSPIAFGPVSGRLGAFDTPKDTRPVLSNPADLDDRLTALFGLADTLSRRITSEARYQVPHDLTVRLSELAQVRRFERVTWYALDDARCSIIDCMNIHDGRANWNDGLVKDLDRISRRVDEIEPLLRPRQILPEDNGAKPPVSEPDLAGASDDEMEAISDALTEELTSPEAAVVLDQTGIDALTRELRHLRQGLGQNASEDARYRWMRRGLLGLTMVIGSYVAAVSQGIVVNALTAPDAAVTLAGRLQAILEVILKFFT